MPIRIEYTRLGQIVRVWVRGVHGESADSGRSP